MKQVYKIFLLLFVVGAIFVVSASNVYSNSKKDSAIAVIARIDKAFDRKEISEHQYLDTIQKTMQLLQSDHLQASREEMQRLLEKFRDVIWRNNRNESFKKSYYSILSNQARFDGRGGEILYFADKLNQLAALDNSFSINATFFIATYYYARLQYGKTANLYNKYRAHLVQIPKMAANQQLERSELMRCSDLLSTFCMGSYNSKDTILGQEIENIMNQLVDSVKKVYASDKELLNRIYYGTIIANHEKYRSLGNMVGVWKSIMDLDHLIADENTPDYLKNFSKFTIGDKKTLFFLDTQKNDSAAYYLNRINQMQGAHSDPNTAYMLKKYHARLLYNNGFFKESEDTLVKALEMIEATNITTGEELDNLIYTLTKVEEQQLLLEDAKIENDRKERLIRLFALGGFFLLFFGIGITLYFRQRQRNKFLEYKLNLARNIHDETGPALLYAKSLAKACKVIGDEGDKIALEKHIDNTMAVLRGLSHDLKTDELQTLGDVVKETEQLLKKLSSVEMFKYEIEDKLSKGKFMSHYQFTQLKAMLQECITNSIKHAEFDLIKIIFESKEKELLIVYTDNGKGWVNENVSSGIGLKNIAERAKMLNGTYVVEGNFPNGNVTRITVPLK